MLEVFEKHKELVCCPGQQTFDAKALYYLSREVTPEAAIKDALKAAKKGERRRGVLLKSAGKGRPQQVMANLPQANGKAREHVGAALHVSGRLVDYATTRKETALISAAQQ